MFPPSASVGETGEMQLKVAYTDEAWSPWPVEWGHSLYASPDYRQRQIAPNHAGLLFYDYPSAYPDFGLGDDTSLTEIDVRLRNDNDADVEGETDERMRLRVTRKGSQVGRTQEVLDVG